MKEGPRTDNKQVEKRGPAPQALPEHLLSLPGSIRLVFPGTRILLPGVHVTQLRLHRQRETHRLYIPPSPPPPRLTSLPPPSLFDSGSKRTHRCTCPTNKKYNILIKDTHSSTSAWRLVLNRTVAGIIQHLLAKRKHNKAIKGLCIFFCVLFRH